MTASSAGQQQQPQAAGSSSSCTKATAASARPTSGASSSYLGATTTNNNSGPSSSVFQQVKQTQSSLARLSRVQQQLHHINQSNNISQTNQSSQQHHQQSGSGKTTSSEQSALAQTSSNTNTNNNTQTKTTNTFLDCINRRFRDCFSEDFCTVPMFVVGNLSPGSDGTHLILPPCVSLCRQNINRFASPKNLRLMNSIRESCKSIEQLDLGGNKLTDLIEVFKILQSTPNLKFLNLSENDLSKSSPVAMATTSQCLSSTSTNFATGHPHFSGHYLSSSSSSAAAAAAVTSSQGIHHQWPASSMTTLNSTTTRSYLGPINQNQQASALIGSRRHSTLGQSTTSATPATSSALSRYPRSRPTILTNSSGSTPGSRKLQDTSAAARSNRLASAALAQSKKTSSSVATKITNSVSNLSQKGVLGSKTNLASGCAGSERVGGAASSTMQLARSLSSLSAKDVRAAASPINRLSQLRSSVSLRQRDPAGTVLRRSSTSLSSGRKQQQVTKSTGTSDKTAATVPIQSSATSPNLSEIARLTDRKLDCEKRQLPVESGKIVGSHQKLFAEPIAETDHDVDMSEGVTPSTSTSNQQSIINNAQAINHSPHNHHHQRLSTNTGSNSSIISRHNQTISSSSSSNNNYKRTFESIRGLALNNTGCQWKVVCSILNRMPNLEELHLSLNNYIKIDLDPSEFKHKSLKKLYLCNNPKLTNWQELDKLLLAFPSLEALSIADCNISQIPKNLSNAREWKKLCGLNINGWPIKEWADVERLNELPSLIDLRCRNLEVLQSIDEPRQHLIARLPKLKRLNGSEIEEREHAEKVFIRFFLINNHLERPSRFHELLQIHGQQVIPVDVDVDLSPPIQASIRVVHLNRNYFNNKEEDILMSEDFLNKLMDNSSLINQQQQDSMEIDSTNNNRLNNSRILFKDEGQEIIAIDVDLRQSIRKFKSTLAQLFDLNSQNMILYYIDHEMIGLMGPELIKHNQKKLWNYNVRDGDQFIVEER